MKSTLPAVHCENCSSRGLGVFCELDDSQLQEFNLAKTTNRYKKGQVIFYEDNQPFGLYCIFGGKIKLYKENPEGRAQILRIAGPGDLLGYRSLFAEEPYHATAEVIEDATICFIDKNFFFKALNKDMTLARQLIRKLAQQLRVAEGLATSLAQRSVRERMAELLITLQEAYGQKTAKGIKIALELSRAELAEMIGITQETSIRLISEFKKKGWIDVQERVLTILNTKALREAANWISLN